MKKAFLFGYIIILCFFASGCSDEKTLKDGYYTAEMENYSFGWKEFVTITVKNNKIEAVEYNARNSSGFIKSWDNAYMRNMNGISGTYPNKYTREYANQLFEKQNYESIDTISGATSSGENFKLLAKAVTEQAQKGDSSVIYVQGKNFEEEGE